uniref:Uncharacterized protein n=1 Tax=Rhizophora mucronata TaxID=61149 RepID=A0A2P2N4R7_RHIMU
MQCGDQLCGKSNGQLWFVMICKQK